MGTKQAYDQWQADTMADFEGNALSSVLSPIDLPKPDLSPEAFIRDIRQKEIDAQVRKYFSEREYLHPGYQ